MFTDITEQMRLEQAQEQERILENRSLRTAICTAYPLIVSVNLTQDTYHCFVNDQLEYQFPQEGRYTELQDSCIPESTVPTRRTSPTPSALMPFFAALHPENRKSIWNCRGGQRTGNTTGFPSTRLPWRIRSATMF